jgi:hypothetical protein|eukprot:COSAG01_NODE_5593_length_4159_cov_2.227340_4_plen_306_part_00
MAFHHNDGSAAHPGSDASLRMPPNTFEPLFNGLQAERQAVPEVARSNAYLGLITANLLHHNWYVFNPVNYVRWPNLNMVDRIFAEFQQLSPSVLSAHTTHHPTVTSIREGDSSSAGNIRARAWRNGPGGDCVHLVVVNSVQEGQLPQPSRFTLELGGLSAAEVGGGATPTFGPGCVVNFTQPPMQAFMCRRVPLVAAGGGPAGGPGSGGARLSDYIGVTEATIYRIGCPLPRADAANYVSDPGFEGGSLSHPQPGPAGIPGYNLDNHQAYWQLIADADLNGDGVPNGRSFDDGSWLRMDATAPHR